MFETLNSLLKNYSIFWNIYHFTQRYSDFLTDTFSPSNWNSSRWHLTVYILIPKGWNMITCITGVRHAFREKYNQFLQFSSSPSESAEMFYSYPVSRILPFVSETRWLGSHFISFMPSYAHITPGWEHWLW